jgi:hypothetical protein
MKKCVFLFFLFVLVLAIASITENRDREAVAKENSKQELALQEKSASTGNLP